MDKLYRNKTAFTLLELVIVIGLIGLIFNMMTNINNNIYRFKERENIYKLVRDCYNLRNQAILEEVNYEIKFNSDENYYILRRTTGLTTLKKVSFNKTSLKILPSGDNLSIRFNKNGTTYGSKTINIKNREGEFYTLSITPVRGQITIRKGG